jgi:hypothetical protein
VDFYLDKYTQNKNWLIPPIEVTIFLDFLVGEKIYFGESELRIDPVASGSEVKRLAD